MKLPKKIFSVIITKLRPSLIVQYLVFFISLVALIYTGWFLYHNVLLGIENAAKVADLKKEVAETKIQIRLFDKVNEKLDKKLKVESTDFGILKDPFIPTPLPSPPTPPSPPENSPEIPPAPITD